MPVILATKTVDQRKAYRTKWERLLQHELNGEMKSMEDRVMNWPIGKLKSEGVALFNMSASICVCDALGLT